MFSNLLEAPEVEAARLAAAPDGSDAHRLSALPVNISQHVQDLIIELPDLRGTGGSIVVVPYEWHPDSSVNAQKPMPRHAGWWGCIVIESSDPRYPVGGHRLSIPESQLVRGTLRTLAQAPDVDVHGSLAHAHSCPGA